jgi:SAM-dependent methyltransferase
MGVLSRLLRRSRAREPAEPNEPAGWHESVPPTPWDRSPPDAPAWCRICDWAGQGFVGPAHSESAVCPQCGSISRDRFLVHCVLERTEPRRGLRILETSPRLDERYRSAMATWFEYTSSDFDERGHRGAVRIDLQAIDLPDRSVGLVLTPHVLEHVPDTDRALSELFRILVPGGAIHLQVPLLQAATAPPTSPEFHGDDTPVFWRFGWDLTERLRAHGFSTTVLVTRSLADAVHTDRTWPLPHSREFDVAGILAAASSEDLVVVAETSTTRQMGFEPGYMFATWEARRPA